MRMMLNNKTRIGCLICAFSLFFVFGSAFAAPVIDLKARGGTHARYNRIVFDWPVSVKYTMKQSGNDVTILFSKPANIDFSGINLPFVKDMRQTTTGEVTEVSFTIPDNSNVQAFWVGKKVAFDVLRLDSNPPVFSEKKITAEEITKGPQKPKITKSPPSPEEIAEQKRLAELEEQKQQEEAQSEAVSPSVETAIKPVEEEEVEPLAADLGETLIRIRPAQDTNMAAFIRNGYLWLVFDKVLSSIPPQVVGDLEETFTRAKRFTTDNGTAYRFTLPVDEMTITPKRVNLNWEILVNQEQKTGDYIRFEPDFISRPSKPRFYANTGVKPNLITLNDPEAGDQLIIAVLPKAGQYTEQTQRFPEFKILPTQMGIVVQPIGDGLTVNALSDGVEITTRSGSLMLSDEGDRISSVQQTSGGSSDEKRLFDLVEWQTGAKKNFNKNRQILEDRITKLEGTTKAAGFTDLAKLYLANGFGAEARGLLKISSTLIPELEQSPDFRALRGAAEALAGNSKRASQDLNIADLKDQPEAHLWLGFARGQAKDWRGAKASFSRAGDIVESYPEVLKSRFILMSAEADVETGDLVNASKKLDSLEYDTLNTNGEKASYRYLRGLTAAKTDNRDIGIEELEKAAKGRDALYHAKAELDLVELQLEDGAIDLKEAINRLEKLRFAWRGDRLEIKTMHRLGQYYIQDQQYAPGLTVLKSAAGLAEEEEDIDTITKDMAEVFVKLYVDGAADDLSPLKALALFNEFRELTPVGREGNIAIQNLSKRLVEVDLLKQADDLLLEQLRYRTSGAEAVEVGTRLAVIRLLARQPKEALQALQESKNTSITADLQNKRDVIKARALADAKRIDEALNLLQGKTSDEAVQLKADINWRAGRWNDSVVALDTLISRSIEEGEDVGQEGLSNLILKKGIALALSGDEVALKRLKATYGPYVEETDNSTAFDLITQPLRGSTLADLATLKAQVAEVELFQEFLKNYR